MSASYKTVTATTFAPAIRRRTRPCSIAFWDKECPTVDSISFTVPAPDGSGNKAIDWNGMLDKPAQAVDQRVKFPRWMQEFEKRGGQISVASTTEPGKSGTVVSLFAPFSSPARKESA